MDSPITTECDVLREEVALLAAETRRPLNEINKLRKVPVYPEAAVRAVWEHGYSSGCVGVSGYYEDNAEDVARIFAEALRDA